MLAPLFLDGPGGRLLAVGFLPAGTACPGHWVMVVPPLFEELNKSRRTLGLLGHALARQGIGCLAVDLLGTGDSEGVLREASWQAWIENLTRARAWLAAQGARRVDPLAVRGGALLAWDWIGATGAQAERLILWQPATGGRQLVGQLLRLRLAAGLMGADNRETAAILRERLARDGWLEIAGYGIPAHLLADLEGAALGAPEGRPIGAVDWYQVVSAPGLSPPPAVLGCVAAWRAADLPTELIEVRGDAFWATQEIVEAKALVAETVRRLADGAPDGSAGAPGDGHAAP